MERSTRRELHFHTALEERDRLIADTLDYTGEDQVALFKGRVKVQLAPR